MSLILRAAKRLPKLPVREALPESEREDFDYMLDRIQKGFGPTAEIVDGEIYGVQHFKALAASPTLARPLSQLGFAVLERQGEPGSYSQSDHEMIDMVLPLDSGYWAFLAGHTPAAIAGGVRVEAIEAIRDKKEHLLTEDERHVVLFIRAVRDGEMTDEIWASMHARLGTEKGVVEFVYMICLLIFHHKFCWAAGVPEMQREAFDKMLQEFKDGTRKPPGPHIPLSKR